MGWRAPRGSTEYDWESQTQDSTQTPSQTQFCNSGGGEGVTVKGVLKIWSRSPGQGEGPKKNIGASGVSSRATVPAKSPRKASFLAKSMAKPLAPGAGGQRLRLSRGNNSPSHYSQALSMAPGLRPCRQQKTKTIKF